MSIQLTPFESYRFEVFFLDPTININAAFQSVSGFSLSSVQKEIKAGGANEEIQPILDSIHTKSLTLTRGFTHDRMLYEWCRTSLEKQSLDEYKSCDILISLLSKYGLPLKSWLLFNAIPKGWSVDDFSASNNKFSIESIQIAYQKFIMI